MSRNYRSWHRDYKIKKFNTSPSIRSKRNSLYKLLKKHELIRIWNGRSKGKYNW